MKMTNIFNFCWIYSWWHFIRLQTSQKRMLPKSIYKLQRFLWLISTKIIHLSFFSIMLSILFKVKAMLFLISTFSKNPQKYFIIMRKMSMKKYWEKLNKISILKFSLPKKLWKNLMRFKEINHIIIKISSLKNISSFKMTLTWNTKNWKKIISKIIEIGKKKF